jgi:DNA polymerase-4
VQLKLKTRSFKLLTRRVTLPGSTQLAETLFKAGQKLLAAEIQRDPRQHYRLIGIGAAELGAPGVPAAQSDLFAAAAPTVDDPKSAALEKAMDAVRGKFGRSAIAKGRGLGAGAARRGRRDLPKVPD